MNNSERQACEYDHFFLIDLIREVYYQYKRQILEFLITSSLADSIS